MKDKVVTADEAISLVRDRDTLSSCGFVQSCVPEALLKALERRYLKTGSPRNLSLFATAGQGDSKTKGLSRLGHEGLLRKVVAGNWGRMPSVCQLALDEKIYAYNLPQGIIAQLFRDLAGGKPGTFSKIGLHTFVDPRHEGGRINKITTPDIVKLVEFEGEEWLFYKVAPVTVAFIRGTTADPMGNITMEREPLALNNLAMAMAAKNSNGIVIAQVERIAERNTLPPRQVRIPGIFVDCVVVAEPEDHMTNLATPYHPGYAGRIRVPVATVPTLPLDERKIIARRAAFELPPNGIVNLGVGVPEGVASVANEEKVLQYITLSVESGVIGGIPASGASFGASLNMDAVIDENQQFDFYDGGGTTNPSVTLSPSIDFPVEPVIRSTLLRRFRAGTRRASPVARHVLATVLSLPPRRSEGAASVRFRLPHAAFALRLRTRPSGLRTFEATFAFTVVTAR